MNPIDPILIPYLTYWRPLGYLIVFLGMMLEGDVMLFAAAFLARAGFFDVGDIFLVLLGGFFLGDVLWYHLGEWLANSNSLVSRWAQRLAKPFDNHLVERPFRTLFISNFTYGLHHAVVVRAGMLKVGLKKFMKDILPANIVWVIVVGGLGYFSGTPILAARHYLRLVEITLLVSLILFIALWGFIGAILRRKL